jgi:hypothetical protein
MKHSFSVSALICVFCGQVRIRLRLCRAVFFVVKKGSSTSMTPVFITHPAQRPIHNGCRLAGRMPAGWSLFQEFCDGPFSGRFHRADQQAILAQVEHVQRAAALQ